MTALSEGTDLSERTDHPGRCNLSSGPDPAAPDQDPAALPPVIHFVPIEGERLEHLATERRGPLRWAASVVLGVQALARRDLRSPAPPLTRRWAAGTPGRTGSPPEAGRTGRSRAEAQAARRRRARRARRARWAGEGRRSVGALAAGGLAGAETTGVEATGAPSPATVVPAPMPGSGWTWNPADEQSWET